MNDQNNNVPGFGAQKSPNDYRTLVHDPSLSASAPLTTGGVHYAPEEIFNQHTVGKCTSHSVIQNVNKATGKHYSEDFLYLLQKKFLDNGWWEGSSIFSAIKAAQKYGLLPIELWTHTTEQDSIDSYENWVAKLQAISDDEINRLLALCEKRIFGYAQVDVSTMESAARAIDSSKAGIVCRYNCGVTWWSPSWLPQDINPIKKPTLAQSTGGHAINMSFYDMTVGGLFEHPNTWGTLWNRQGKGDIVWNEYQPTEAWIIYYSPIPPLPKLPDHRPITRNLFIGCTGDDVKRLQVVLGVDPAGVFGPKTFAAVVQYQKDRGISPTGFVGTLTRQSLNARYFYE